MEKTLAELSDEYLANAEAQTALIRKNRIKLAKARKDGNKNEEIRLTQLLTLFYCQRREQLETAATLKHYYKFSSFSIE